MCVCVCDYCRAVAADKGTQQALAKPNLPESNLGEAAVSGRRHDVGEAVWFTFKTSIFAGREILNKEEAGALLDWLTVLADLLPSGAGNDVIAEVLIPLLLASSGPGGKLTFAAWDSAVDGCIATIKSRDPNTADGDGTPHPNLGEGSDWKFCSDVGMHTRGYTCGLWVTFHTLSVRAAMQTTGGEKVGDDVGGKYTNNYLTVACGAVPTCGPWSDMTHCL